MEAFTAVKSDWPETFQDAANTFGSNQAQPIRATETMGRRPATRLTSENRVAALAPKMLTAVKSQMAPTAVRASATGLASAGTKTAK